MLLLLMTWMSFSTACLAASAGVWNKQYGLCNCIKMSIFIYRVQRYEKKMIYATKSRIFFKDLAKNRLVFMRTFSQICVFL